MRVLFIGKREGIEADSQIWIIQIWLEYKMSEIN